jgi:Pectate lyase superfamily protein
MPFRRKPLASAELVGRALVILVAATGLRPPIALADTPDTVSVRDYGAKGDGSTDDTLAFQKALDALAKGGGRVRVERGTYYFAGHLSVPRGVTLEGIWKSVPAHAGIRDPGEVKPTDDGTTFLVTANRGSEAGEPFITLHDNSTLTGVVLYYPAQKVDEPPAAYPYAIAMRGNNPAILHVELLNPYNGIDATRNNRHLIRDVSGQPLRRGIFVDRVYDIGRIEDVHFNPWWSMHERLLKWQMENGEAFIFGRSDWQYVLNTFCLGYHVGYRFIETPNGMCNGNFLGIGADVCYTSVVVDASPRYGILITNGEFVSLEGPDPTMVAVSKFNSGSVRFVNCAFWGACNQIARIAGSGTVGFSDCTFMQWDSRDEGRAAIQVESGSVVIRGCEFQETKAQIDLRANVRRAVISDNIISGPERIKNNSQGNVKIANNASG